MADAQVPTEAGDAQPSPERRQALRLSDTEGAAATRLDMFGDPSLKESLAGAPSGASPPGNAALPQSPLDAPADQPPPAGAAGDAAQPAPLDQPPSNAPSPAPLPASLPAPDVEHRLDVALSLWDVDVEQRMPDAGGHPASAAPPEPRPAAPRAGQSVAAEPTPADAPPAADAEAAPLLGASDAAAASPAEPAQEKRYAGVALSGPLGVPFMMPPGSSEQGLDDLAGGPMNEPPRFRDELMFVRDTDGNPVAADATILPATEPSPLPELPPEPAFTEPAFTEPAFTEPAFTEPAFAQPAFTEPAFTQPAFTEPALTEPAFTQPAFTEPAVTEPAFKQPMFTQATVTQPTVTESAFTQPTVAQPTFTEHHDQLPDDLPGASAFPAFPAVSPYPEAGTGFHDASPLPPDPEPPSPPPLVDAAAKIAAEANATAAALDNLERLLGQRPPHLHAAAPAYQPDPFRDPPGERAVSRIPRADSLRLRMQGLEAEPPSHAPYHAPAPLPPMPLPVRPPSSGRSIYLKGFLAGLVLSLMAGLVLYFFIMHAGPG